MKRFMIGFACLILTVDARAQADKVDEYIEAEMRKQHIPGLSLAVVQAGCTRS